MKLLAVRPEKFESRLGQVSEDKAGWSALDQQEIAFAQVVANVAVFFGCTLF